MGKGKRKREREARRQGLTDTTRDREKKAREAQRIARAAVENGPRAKPSPTARALAPGFVGGVPLDPRRAEVEAAQMQAWRDAGEP